jgi:pimeloyl-ACP methyl ester carboxylesterase
MLRGLGRESRHWGPFLPAFRAAASNCDVVALDLPGTGTNLRSKAPSTMREMVESVREEASSRGLLGAPLLLFGISLGGMVALEWANSHPEDLSGVVIAASSAPDLSPLLKRFSLAGLGGLLLNMLTRDPERRHRRIARVVSNRPDIRDRVVREWMQIERDRPVTSATVRAQMNAASHWRAPASLRVPSMFLVGREDRLVHPDCSRALARRFAAPLEEHPDAGHDLTTDAPEWVVEQCMRWAARTVTEETS